MKKYFSGKSIINLDAEFEKMLDARRLEGDGRQVLLDLATDKKELLLAQHLKDTKESKARVSEGFWKSMKPRRKSQTHHQSNSSLNDIDTITIETDFLNAISKSCLPPHEIKKMLKSFTVQEKWEYTRNALLESNKDMINEEFLSLLKDCNPDEMKTLLSYDLSSRHDYIEKKRALAGPKYTNIQHVQENSALWLILSIYNPDSSLKTIYRSISFLRKQLEKEEYPENSPFFTETALVEKYNNLSGFKAFEIALERVFIHSTQEIEKKAAVWYADQIHPDEIRLEILHCLSLIMATNNTRIFLAIKENLLIRQLFRFLSLPSPDSQAEIMANVKSRTTYLAVTTLLGKFIGPLIFRDPSLAEIFLAEIHDLKRRQHESLPCSYLTSMLYNPFGFVLSFDQCLLPDEQYHSELDDIWAFRTSLLFLLNAVVSSGDDLNTRIRRRSFLENSGARTVFRTLINNFASPEFTQQTRLFNQDRDEDMALIAKQDLDRPVDLSVSIKTLDSTFLKIKQLSDPSLLNWRLSKIIAHIHDIISEMDEGNPGTFTEINTMISVIENTCNALADSVKAHEKRFSQKDSATLEWKSKFFEAAFDVAGESPVRSLTDLSVKKMGLEIKRLQLVVSSFENEQLSKSRELYSEELSGVLNSRKELEKVNQSSPHVDPVKSVSAEANQVASPEAKKDLPSDLQNVIAKSPKSLKYLQWDAVTGPSSFWEEIFTSAYNNVGVLLEEEKIMQLFTRISKGKEPISVTLPSSPCFVEPQLVTFLNPKQTHNIEIFMIALRRSPSQLKKDLLQISGTELNLDIITRIQRILPSQDVVESIMSFTEPESQLALADRFVFTLYSIPKINARLKCIAFYFRFPEEFAELSPDIVCIRAAIREIRTSESFSFILKVLLVTGNYMNGDGFRGNSRGFKLGALLCLKNTVSNGDPSTPTLLHFLARILAEKNTDALNFLEKMPNVRSTSRISAPGLNDVVKELSVGFRFVTEELRQPLISVSLDQFRDVFEEFVAKSLPKMQSLREKIEIMNFDLKDLLLGLGEEEEENDGHVFGMVFQFSRDLYSAHLENKDFDLQQMQRDMLTSPKLDKDMSSPIEDN